jgi:uncharacterized protein YycO
VKIKLITLTIPKWILKLSGKLYFCKNPMFVSYNPAHHKVTGVETRQILKLIKPGDILLRRYDGYLNTLCTPGFWGHAAICIGDNVIHAVGEGVIEEDLLDFCRTDSIAVLRVNKKLLTGLAINNAIKMLGKPYDYDFSPYGGTAKLDAMYCTKLVDYAYGHLFNDEYTYDTGTPILVPDSIEKSEHVKIIIKIVHRR